MRQLYGDTELETWRQRTACFRKWCFALLALSLLTTVPLCFFVRTENQRVLQWTAIFLFTVLEWAALLVWQLGELPARTELTHLEGILKGEPETREGIFSLLRDQVQIPKSVRVRKAILDTPEGPIHLQVNIRMIPKLPENASSVRVQMVRKFLIAWEPMPCPDEGKRDHSADGTEGNEA